MADPGAVPPYALDHIEDHTNPAITAQRRVAALVERNATSVEDAHRLMEVLGISPDVFRLQWARTVQLGSAGTLTLALDLDVRRVSDRDRQFLADLVASLTQLVALHDPTENRDD